MSRTQPGLRSGRAQKKHGTQVQPLTVGLASLDPVVALTPVHAACTEMQGQNTGFRQNLYRMKTYYIAIIVASLQ